MPVMVPVLKLDKMNYSATKRYISVRRFFSDLSETLLRVFFLSFLLVIVVYVSVSACHEATKVKIVRDTVYISTEVEVKGPNKYREYFDERHPLDLTTSDGTYHFKLISR